LAKKIPNTAKSRTSSFAASEGKGASPSSGRGPIRMKAQRGRRGVGEVEGLLRARPWGRFPNKTPFHFLLAREGLMIAMPAIRGKKKDAGPTGRPPRRQIRRGEWQEWEGTTRHTRGPLPWRAAAWPWPGGRGVRPPRAALVPMDWGDVVRWIGKPGESVACPDHGLTLPFRVCAAKLILGEIVTEQLRSDTTP